MTPYKKGKSERIDFQGTTFFRYPDSENRSLRVYFNPTPLDIKKGIQSLHREIYKANIGAIPEGSHIHHRDGNPLNNEPENLECLTASEHVKEHLSDEAFVELRRLGKIRFQSYQKERAEWMKTTPEGQEWTKKHHQMIIEKAVEKRGVSTITCIICGKMATKAGKPNGEPAQYCSRPCIQTAFRLRAGLSTPPREFICEHCGKAGVTTRKVRRYCTRECKHQSRLKG